LPRALAWGTLNYPKSTSTDESKIRPAVDILYMRLTDARIDESEETQPGVVIDYDAEGNVVGFEIMNASKKMKQPALVELEVA
jgi:uncharacterized protein YuzE